MSFWLHDSSIYIKIRSSYRYGANRHNIYIKVRSLHHYGVNHHNIPVVTDYNGCKHIVVPTITNHFDPLDYKKIRLLLQVYVIVYCKQCSM